MRKQYVEYLSRIRKKITSYLDREKFEYKETDSIESLASIADRLWETSTLNQKRNRRKQRVLSPVFIDSLREYYYEHGQEETAEYFGYTLTTIKKYKNRFNLIRNPESVKKVRSESKKNNLNGLGKRLKTTKVNPEEFKNSFIKFR